MILRILGADFSSANIGTLSTYVISKSIGAGISHNIPNFVDKNSSVTWTLTVAEGYLLGSYSIIMNGETITPVVNENTMTITIPSVTGNVRIVITSINENTGEEDIPVVPPVPPVEPDEPTGYVVYDSFNRANGDLITSDSGHNWVRYSGDANTIQIQDNKVTSFSGYPSALLKIGSGDRIVQAAIEFNGTGQILLYSRMADSITDTTKSYYVAVRVNSDGLSLLYKDGSANTVIQTIPLSSSSFVLKIEVIGDTHNVYVDDEMVMSNDVVKFADAPYVGIQVTNGNYVDDFKSTMNNVNEDVPGEGGEDENTQAVGLVYDSFDRADTTFGIGTSDSGYIWEYPVNAGNKDAILISNGTVISKTAYPSAVCNLGAGDKSVEAVVNASNAGQILLYSRYDLQTSQDYVCVRAKNDGLTLMYKQNGTNSEIQTIPIAQLTKQYPFTLKLEVIGDTHNVYVDDEMVMSQDVTLFNDKTYVGFSINGRGNYVDDFRAEIITQ